MCVAHLRGWITTLFSLYLAMMLAIILPGCSIKFVADYDTISVDQLLATYGKIDRFYDRLAETPPAERTYDAFQADWGGIATDLRTFTLRQSIRELNQESAVIADMMVKNWERERSVHKRNSADPAKRDDPYPTTTIAQDREQFEGWFYAAVSAERFKQ